MYYYKPWSWQYGLVPPAGIVHAFYVENSPRFSVYSNGCIYMAFFKSSLNVIYVASLGFKNLQKMLFCMRKLRQRCCNFSETGKVIEVLSEWIQDLRSCPSRRVFMTLDKSSLYVMHQFCLWMWALLLLHWAARDKIYGKLNEAARVARRLEHVIAEINSHDACVDSL